MLFVYTFSFVVILLSICSSLRIMKYGLEWSFILLFLFCALRYDYGPDYMGYYLDYNEFCGKYNFSNFLTDAKSRNEPLWAIICLLFKPVGFFGLVAALSAFSCIVYYKFIKTNIPVRYQWIVVYFYIINPYTFWIPLSMMREAFSIAIFVASIKFFYERKILYSILIAYVAFSIHNSALILFPFIFSGYLLLNRGKILAVCLFLLFTVFVASASYLLEYALPIALANDRLNDYYSIYGGVEGAGKFGIGAWLALIPFFIILVYMWSSQKWTQNLNRYINFIVLLGSVDYILSPIVLLNGFLGRFAYYFKFLSISIIPVTFLVIANKYLRNSIIILQMIISLYTYINMFDDPSWVSFREYKTILFAD